MSVFILVAALLVAGALVYVLRPLLRGRSRESVSHDQANVAVYRDQLRELEADLRVGTIATEQYEKARQEIEKRLLEDMGAPTDAAAPRRAPLAAVAVGIAIPVCALAVYLAVGTPAAIVPRTVQQAGTHDVSSQEITAMIERLAARLKEQPDNPGGWAMLARSYSAIGRFGDASAAFAEAAKRVPDDAQLLADYADALGMAQGKTLAGEPEKLIARALKIDPNNVKALALAGSAAFDRKQYAEASTQWERILAVAPPDSPLAQSIRSSIDEARGLAGKPPLEPAETTNQASNAGAARVSGVARLAPEVAKRVSPDDTVFIYAHAAEGSKMPLAILRKQVRDLPVSFVLDDSMAMNPQMKLSAFPRVIVSARVSKSSNATPRPGDFQGETAPIKVGAERLDVVISSEVR